MPFLIIFVLIPIAEVYTFINVGEEIGVLQTLLLCVLTAMIGGYLVRQQGLGTLMKAQGSLRSGGLPLTEIFDGFCIVIAGALLLTPGFVTDTIGFSLLIPFLRKILQGALSKYGHFQATGTGTEPPPNRPTQDSVIEGDYERVNEENEKLDKTNKSL